MPEIICGTKKVALEQVIILPPEKCFACGGELKVDGASVVCQNEECEGKAIRRIKSWIGKRNIKFLGDELLVKLFDNYGIKEPHDLYSLTYEVLSNVPRGAGRVGTAAKQILAEVEKSKVASLSDFLGSICIKFLGRRQVEIIMDAAPAVGVKAGSLADFLTLSAEDLGKLPGFGSGAKASGIIDGIRKARPTIQKLMEAGVVVEDAPVKVVSAGAVDHPFAGRTMCFTGVRMNSDQKIKFGRIGAVEKSGVSKGLDFLVQKDIQSESSKSKKAKELGVTVMSMDEFVRVLGI